MRRYSSHLYLVRRPWQAQGRLKAMQTGDEQLAYDPSTRNGMDFAFSPIGVQKSIEVTSGTLKSFQIIVE